jgi:hypothetical protein
MPHTVTRPKIVIVALVLLWAHLGIGVINALGVAAWTQRWEIILLPFYIGFMVLLRSIAQGRHWARVAYIILLIPGVFATVLAFRELPPLRDQVTVWDEIASGARPESSVTEDGTIVTIECTICGLQQPDFLKWEIASNIVAIGRMIVLMAGLLLLFTPMANRWFRPPGPQSS